MRPDENNLKVPS